MSNLHRPDRPWFVGRMLKVAKRLRFALWDKGDEPAYQRRALERWEGRGRPVAGLGGRAEDGNTFCAVFGTCHACCSCGVAVNVQIALASLRRRMPRYVALSESKLFARRRISEVALF